MKKYILGILLAFGFFVASLLTLSDYGMNEDSPGHFLRGQAYLRLLTTGKLFFDQPRLPSPILFIPGQKVSSYKLNAWEEITASRRVITSFEGVPSGQLAFKHYQEQFGRQSFYKHNAWSPDYFMKNEGVGHPPISDILAALTNRVFYEGLGILGDIESYHLYVVLTATLLLIAVYYFTYKIWGGFSAMLSVLCLALYPLFFSESHFNIKDIPSTSFIGISIISFYFWVVTRKTRWFALFTIASFLAVGTKLNVVFLPVIILPWLFVIRKTFIFKQWFSKKIFIFAFIFFVFNILFFILLWPWLWDSPIQRLTEVLKFYQQTGSSDIRIETPPLFFIMGINLSPLAFFVTMTPIVTLALFFAGLTRMVYSWRGPNLAYFLLAMWLIVPFVRVLRPGAEVFGSMRQFMEFLPSLAIIAGVGGQFLIFNFQFLIKSKFSKFKFLNILNSFQILLLPSAFCILVFALLLIPIIRFHPNENVYFNAFIGGLKGAKNQGLLSWQTAYDNPYRQGLNWLNNHAPLNAKLAYLDGTMQAIPSIWLRDDILFGSHFSGLSQKGEYIISIIYPEPPPVFAYLYLERFLDPIYTVTVDGVPLVSIFENNSAHAKAGLKDTFVLSSGFKQTQSKSVKFGDYWEVDLGRDFNLVSVVLKYPSKNCQKHDGLFSLALHSNSSGYMIPERIDRSEDTTEFFFPAQITRFIRFYGLSKSSCFIKGMVEKIMYLP